MKPVLEWTNADWARWIESADAGQLPAVEATEESGEAATGTAVATTEPEPDVAPDAEADDEWSPEPADAPEDDDDGGPEPVVAEKLEAIDAAGAMPDAVAPEDPEAGEDWSPEPAVAEKPEAVATEPAGEVVPAGSWDIAGEAPSTEPSPSDQADDDSDRDDVAAAAAIPAAPATDTAVEGDEWLGVADHPWWESAPVRDEPNLLDPDQVTSVETPSGRFPRAEASEAPAPAAATATATERPPPSITRAMPAAPTGRGDDVVRRRPAAPEASHRVRSAFGLVGVAVTVGMVVAGLITVAIFAISLALRQAVG